MGWISLRIINPHYHRLASSIYFCYLYFYDYYYYYWYHNYWCRYLWRKKCVIPGNSLIAMNLIFRFNCIDNVLLVYSSVAYFVSHRCFVLKLNYLCPREFSKVTMQLEVPASSMIYGIVYAVYMHYGIMSVWLVCIVGVNEGLGVLH